MSESPRVLATRFARYCYSMGSARFLLCLLQITCRRDSDVAFVDESSISISLLTFEWPGTTVLDIAVIMAIMEGSLDHRTP
jgi:hypothetical protein